MDFLIKSHLSYIHSVILLNCVCVRTRMCVASDPCRPLKCVKNELRHTPKHTRYWNFVDLEGVLLDIFRFP